MKGTTKIAVVVALVIVIIGGSFVAKELNKDRTNDTYYYYLDGMGDINGWYSTTSDNPANGLIKAMSDSNIDCVIGKNGWLVSIDGHLGDSASKIGYAIFEYTSTSVESPSNAYFFSGPVISKITSNIAYISYGSYTYAEYNMTYNVRPSTNTDAEFLTSGPFAADSGYKPLKSSMLYQTYYIYLDGMGDLNGWYSANASNQLDGFKGALDSAGINYVVSDSGWIKAIGNNVSETDSKYFGAFGYFSTDVIPGAWTGNFFAGPAVSTVASNIIYISYGGYTWDPVTGTAYDVNPNVCDGLNTTGPFAA